MAPSLEPRETNGNQTSDQSSGHEDGLTPGTNGQANGSAQGISYPTYVQPDTPYRILPQYHSKPTKLRVACIGAAVSGICLAYKMERQMISGSWELTL